MQKSHSLLISQNATIRAMAPERATKQPRYYLSVDQQHRHSFIAIDHHYTPKIISSFHQDSSIASIHTSEKNDCIALLFKESVQVCKLAADSLEIVWEDKGSEFIGVGVQAENVVILDRHKLRSVQIDSGKMEREVQLDQLQHLALDTQKKNLVACSRGCGIQVFDLSTKQDKTVTLQKAHRLPITYLQYNPSRPCSLLSSSLDLTSKLWDTRKLQLPLKVIRHEAIPYQSCINPCHEDLMLFAYEEGMMGLRHCSDGVIKIYDEHEHEVVGLGWAANTCWCYGSAGKTGWLMCGTVPEGQKMRIML